MLDTSVVERKIRDQVMDMTFKAIVTEAFIGGLPIAENELNDDLTQGFVRYANECLEDLGSYRMLDQAIESAKDPVKKGYLKKMKAICMEAAQDVTARILKENTGNDKDLLNEAKAVTLTPAEYARFSKNAASLTPESLTKMIQKKTLDVIKEEKEAYQKDAELENELKNALNTTSDDPEVEISTEPQGDAPNGPDTQSEAPDQDINDMQANNDAPTGADIGQKAENIAQTMNSLGNESYFTDVQNQSQKDPAKNITGMQIGMACPCPKHQQEESNKDPVKKAVDHKASAQVGQQGMHTEAVRGTSDPKKAQEAFESYMKALAGERNHPKHSSVFSRLQELTYESMLGTTESYDAIPFKTMTDVTKHDTFDVFKSHGTKNFDSVVESIGLYAFESAGVPDAPDAPNATPAPAVPNQDAALGNSLLVASIIYTFFETLNSMNLYCPKLKEIRDFVDETLPIKNRVSLDMGVFKGMIQNMIDSAANQLRKADTAQDVDALQQNLDIVREKMAAPGFEAARAEINKAIEAIQTMIDRRRDEDIAKAQPAKIAVESYSDTLKRTRDLMKFDRSANLLGRKPNVVSLRCKVDPQGSSKYIAVEAFDARHNVVGKSTIVLESALMGNLIDYAVTTLKSSKMMNLDKPILVTDSRSGKTYFDSTKK